MLKKYIVYPFLAAQRAKSKNKTIIHRSKRTAIRLNPEGNDQKKKIKSMLEDNKTANNHHHLQYNQSHDGAHRAKSVQMNL